MKKLILTALFLLFLSAFTFAESRPVIKFMSGKVEFNRSGSWKDAWSSMSLKLSDKIRVSGDNSYLTITYNGKEYSIKPNVPDKVSNIVSGESNALNHKASSEESYLGKRRFSAVVTGIRDSSLTEAFELYENGKTSEAFDAAQKFVERTPPQDPNVVKGYYLMSKILYENSQFDKALEYLSEIKKIGLENLSSEEEKDFCLMRGEAYYKVDDYGNAIAWMTQYTMAYKDKSEQTLFAYYVLAMSYKEMGMKKEARKIYKKMKKLNKKHKLTKRVRKKL